AYRARGQEVVLVNARLAVVGRPPSLPAELALDVRTGAALPRTRRIYLDRWVEAPVHDLEAVAPGLEVKGPAIFESPTTTVLIRSDERAAVTPHGWLDVRLWQSDALLGVFSRTGPSPKLSGRISRQAARACVARSPSE